MRKTIFTCDYQECKREVPENAVIIVTTGHSACPASAKTETEESPVNLCYEHALKLVRQIVEKYNEDTGRIWFNRVTGRNNQYLS